MQEGYFSSWRNIENGGWDVVLTDKASEEYVTTKLCTSVNDRPIISTRYMFDMSKVKNIDLSSFDTTNVTTMASMFTGTRLLKTIKVSDKFQTDQVIHSYEMFTLATSLVGGNGTVYDANHIDKEYARIDTPDTPGYFTIVN